MFTRFYLLCLLYFALIYSCSAKHITETQYIDRYYTNYYTNKYFYTNDFYYLEYNKYSNELDKLQYITNRSLYVKYSEVYDKYNYYYFENNYLYNLSTTSYKIENINFDLLDTRIKINARYYITNINNFDYCRATNSRTYLNYKFSSSFHFLYTQTPNHFYSPYFITYERLY